MPFSDWRITSIPAGMWFAISVGMPIPRLTVNPSRSSRTARRMIPSRSSIPSERSRPERHFRTVRRSIRFSRGATTTRFTKTPGV
jgi:hypothetical protein